MDIGGLRKGRKGRGGGSTHGRRVAEEIPLSKGAYMTSQLEGAKLDRKHKVGIKPAPNSVYTQ